MTTLGSLIVLALFVGTASATSLGTVYTESGAVRGDNIFLGIGRRMDVFKGIPFADMPGRFEKPRPHPGWDGVLRAMNYRERCMQLNLKMDDIRGSEDCLYLNIWVPHGRKVSINLPVMIWIFGGGFLAGGSMGANFLDNYLYDGQELADRGDVIVVTLAYRVGTLGFLSTGDASMPGNYGLWDQQAAIAWVYRNIRGFGGNPNSITLFGESAGGASVNFQILTPHNKGMIKGAISQSGTAFCPWAINTNPRALIEEVALKVNCPTDDTMVACLKVVDPWQLTLAAKIEIQGSPQNPVVYNLKFAPVIDGDFLPDEPANLFGNAADVDYIAGANDMDGHIFTAFDVANLNNAFEETSVEDLKALLGSYTKEKGTAGQDAAFNLYTSAWEPEPTWETIKRTVVAVGTDYIFLIPTQAALYMHAAHAKTGRTYSYLLSEPNRLGGVGKPYPTWMGADHMDDLQYVFGKPFSSPLGYWPSQRDLSKYFIAYWTNFAKSGDPNQGGHQVPVIWPALNSAGEYLELNGRMSSSNAVKQLLRLPFVEFWAQAFPNINSTQSA